MALSGGNKAPESPPERLHPAIHYGFIVVQLALVIAAAVRFRFESPAFQQALPWIGVAIIAHHLLPAALRLQFFAAMSIGSIVYVLGIGPGYFDWSHALGRGGLIVGVGLCLIAICHLPISFRLRVTALFSFGAALLVFRAGTVFDGQFADVWPLIGALFMFRLIVYAYDTQHESERAPISRILSYFFMLPNAFFPFFPVVDWKTFGRDYYNEEALVIYQRGLHWMVRGITHMILYRIVYYHFYIGAENIADGESLLRYVLANYGLYLRVSGQFHMIGGLLLLFGFNLPVTNHHYFLADSFTDYWRRVNIYWKDFMVKIFYTPTAFRLRGRGPVLPVVIGSANAFVATWLLHLYQSYWLRGGFYFSTQDAVFWIALGVLVMVNSAREVKRGRRRSLSNKFDLRSTASSCLGTMGVFGVMAVLWSLWSSHSIGQWLSIWQYADGDFYLYFIITLLVVGLTKLCVELMNSFGSEILSGKIPRGADWRQLTKYAVVTVVLPATVIWLLGDARVLRRVDAKTKFILKSLKSNQPNTSDLNSIERGYYENLFDASSSNFMDSGAQAPPNWIDFPQIDILRETGDMRFWTLEPSRNEAINGFRLTTNELGLRDKEYSAEKPADAYRIALLGSSHVMGWSVHDTESFGAQVEMALSEARINGKKIEILNFGVGGYSPVCQLGVMREAALATQPDAIYYIAHAVENTLATERLARLVQREIPIEDAFLNDILKRADVKSSMSQIAIQRELPAYAEEITAGAYRELVEISRDADILPVWIYVPRVTELDPYRAPIDALIQMAEHAGFITHDLSGLFDDTDVDDIAVAQWDLHPNALGHEMIAQAILEWMRTDSRLGLDTSP